MTTTRQGRQLHRRAIPVSTRAGAPPRSRAEHLAHHRTFAAFRTPAIDTLAISMRTLMILGRHQRTTARTTLISTGLAAAEKTTTLPHAPDTSPTSPTPPGPDRPTHVLAPPSVTAKALPAGFARHLGIPITTRMP